MMGLQVSTPKTPPTLDRLAFVRDRVASEVPVPVPATIQEWRALDIEDQRRLRAQDPGFSAQRLPSEPNHRERQIAHLLARAEREGLPTTAEAYHALPAEEQSRIRVEHGAWFDARSLPRTTPTDPYAGNRALTARAEEALRLANEARARGDYIAPPESPDQRKAREAASVDRRHAKTPETFAEWQRLTLEQQRGLRDRVRDFRPRELPGGPYAKGSR